MDETEYAEKYLELIQRFTDGELAASKFSTQYMELFLDDGNAPSEELFKPLDYLFAEADAYCEPELRDEVRGSIGEEELLEAAQETEEKIEQSLES